MSSKEPNFCRIKLKHAGNYSYLTMPDGTLIPCQVLCRVTNVVNDRPYAIVKVFVNLDDTVEDHDLNQPYEEL